MIDEDLNEAKKEYLLKVKAFQYMALKNMSSENIKKIIPVILAGGTGSRLWPLSRKSFPKQFLNLLDDQYTMLQKTYKRIENLDNICRPIVICSEEHRFIVVIRCKK